MKIILKLLLFALISFNLRIIAARRGTIVNDLNDNETYSFLIIHGQLLSERNLDYTQNSKKVASLRTETFIEYWGDNHFCAGVLVSRRMVLTAAHCIMDKYRIPLNEGRVRVIAGSPERLSPSEDAIEMVVNRIVPHPKYKRYTRNDIAILLMKEDIPLSRTVKLSPLAKATPSINEQCYIFGWGQMYPNGPYADEVMFIDVIIVPAKECHRFFKDYDDIGQLCGFDEDEVGDVCSGDIGGPLFCDNRLAGIVAGTEMCTGNRPMKFTNVAYFEDWIHRTQVSRATLLLVRMLCFSLSFTPFISNS